MSEIKHITPAQAGYPAAPEQSPGHRGAPEPKQAQQAPASHAEVARAVDQINEFIQIVRRDLRFGMDEATGHIVVTVSDANSEQVVRQIPSEEALHIARNLGELSGLLLHAKA